MALPSSEKDFVRKLLAIPYSKRSAAVQGLVLTGRDNVLPLLQSILSTEPLVDAINVVQPPNKEVELAADGGNPDPVVVTQALRFPQTNASKRYYQREAAVAMASTLAALGNKDAIALLIAALNHPSTIGKKTVIQCLARVADDQDLLTASKTSPPAVRDSLVACLLKNKRKELARDILGKPRKTITSTEPVVAITTRLRRALEKAQDHERETVWNEYANAIDVLNIPKPGVCEEGESLKDVILALQELLPPLYPVYPDRPEQRDHKLSSIIEKHLVAFLAHDAERVIRILKNTSWSHIGQNGYWFHLPTALHSGPKTCRFWSHRQDNGQALREFWMHLIAVGDGALVREGRLPTATLFKSCRTPVVDELVRTALNLLNADSFNTNILKNTIMAQSHLSNILAFATTGVKNLIHRLAKCSALQDRTKSAKDIRETVSGLLIELLSVAMRSLRIFFKAEPKFNKHLYAYIMLPLIRDTAHGEWSANPSNPLKSFPPLGQLIFDQLHSIFTPMSRTETSIMTIIENLLRILAPHYPSVYSLPDTKFEQPFSSIPPWDNTNVFTKCIVDSLNGIGRRSRPHFDAQWVGHFNKIAPHLQESQRDVIAEWVMAAPNLTKLLDETRGTAIFSLLDSIFTNINLRHQFVFPLVFAEKKDKQVNLANNAAEWAAYLDIRLPNVRALLAKEALKPSFDERLQWIKAILKATRISRSVHEWILTLKWLLPKIRNETQPNLVLLAPFLCPDLPCIPRQYLDDATLEQAVELEALYLRMESQNASAITPVDGIARFLDAIASQAFGRFISFPNHPFFRLGHEIAWRKVLRTHGEKGALGSYNLNINAPLYADSDRHEDTEIARRRNATSNDVEWETQGLGHGYVNIVDGQEEAVVASKLNILYTRWLSVKSVLDPTVMTDDIQAFKEAQPSVWRNACYDFLGALGWRWKLSPTLVNYFNEQLDKLAAAPVKTFGDDKVLDWGADDSMREASQYIAYIYDRYQTKWIRHNIDSLPLFKRYSELRLSSTEAASEAVAQLLLCEQDNGKRDNDLYEKTVVRLLDLSPSVIALTQIRDYLSIWRPDLLRDEHLTATTKIRGRFNTVEEEEPWEFFIKKTSKLNPHQCELLKARHLQGMLDASIPFATRVLHAESFVAIPSTTIQDIAEVLATPSLPSRIIEALLMYLPTLAEPGVSLSLLLAPVYLQSHMARTAIHAVENALKHIPLGDIPEYIWPLFPPAGGRQHKVTVQKEGVRLACSTMALFVDPRIQQLIKDLWSRPELHVDVRTAMLQSFLGLLFSPAAKEPRYEAEVQWIWHVLGETARSDELKVAGASFVLLATNPVVKDVPNAPFVDVASFVWVDISNATLDNLAKVNVPEAHVPRYVDEVLIPLLGKPSNMDDKDLVEVWKLAIQCLVRGKGWISSRNAGEVAKAWRAEAARVALDDPHQLWPMFADGIRCCVGKEVAGAVASNQEGMVAWTELVGLVQDLATCFLDKGLTRTQRQQALARIKFMDLGSAFTLRNFDKVSKAVFHGEDSDLMQPLLVKGLESVMWKASLTRDINVFTPYRPMTDSEINKRSLEILIRMAHLSSKYVSEPSEVNELMEAMLKKSKNNVAMLRHLGSALLTPIDELVDWVHLNPVTLTVLRRNVKGAIRLDDIGGFVERVAKHDGSFYWVNHSLIRTVLATEMERRTGNNPRLNVVQLDKIDFLKALGPMISRAEEQGWDRGTDAMLFRNWVVQSRLPPYLCAVMPTQVGVVMHKHIVSSVQIGELLTAQIDAFVMQPSQAMTKFSNANDAAYFVNFHIGLPLLTTILIEGVLNRNIEGLDLRTVMQDHTVPKDVMEGHWYSFYDGRHDSPRSLEQVRHRWNGLMDTYSDSYKPVLNSVSHSNTKHQPSEVVAAYHSLAKTLLTQLPKFILYRPFEYLEYIRLTLTAPGTLLTPQEVSTQIVAAFRPVPQIIFDDSNFGWAPPLSLALDLVEYIMNTMRAEVELEGEREVQIIELLAAKTLQEWKNTVLETGCGKKMAKYEGADELKARFLALVDQLCEDGSGGQSVALTIGDFIPGGAQSASEAFEVEEDETEDDDEDMSDEGSEMDTE
ncbi:hypothetical protein BGZ94_007159 [Podila epigama]|nr:hypothetical protein BGZ94_007159 [Podila epigama]